jgi:hypothetical protein
LQKDGLAAVAQELHCVPSSTLPTQAVGVVPDGAEQTLLEQLSDKQSSLTLQLAASAHCLQLESYSVAHEAAQLPPQSLPVSVPF